MNLKVHKKSCDLVSCCSTSSEERDEESLTLKTNPLKHKTELCKNFSENAQCPYGSRCRFAHGPHQLINLPSGKSFRRRRCNGFWKNGCCPYGVRCQFGHEDAGWDRPAALMALSCVHAQSGSVGASRLLAMLTRQ